MSGPSSYPAGNGGVFSSPPRWGRLNYPDGKKRWHATRGFRSICGYTSFDHPRAEFSASRPLKGKLCKRCVEKLAGVA